MTLGLLLRGPTDIMQMCYVQDVFPLNPDRAKISSLLTEMCAGSSLKSVCVYNVTSEMLPFSLSHKTLDIPATFLL